MNSATSDNELIASVYRGLSRVWIDFESALVNVPIIARMLGGKLRLEDYKRLLVNLRQQVVEGGRWISRGASNLGGGHEELRSLFVKHAAAEHRDFLLLEKNFVAVGGNLVLMRSTPKNIGSEALSAFLYHTASQPNPLGMLGAMFIIESLGQRLADQWADDIQRQLGISDEGVSFFRYHGANDVDHINMFDKALVLAVTTPEIGNEIVRHARVVARLYRLQLEELDNV